MGEQDVADQRGTFVYCVSLVGCVRDNLLLLDLYYPRYIFWYVFKAHVSLNTDYLSCLLLFFLYHLYKAA